MINPMVGVRFKGFHTNIVRGSQELLLHVDGPDYNLLPPILQYKSPAKVPSKEVPSARTVEVYLRRVGEKIRFRPLSEVLAQGGKNQWEIGIGSEDMRGLIEKLERDPNGQRLGLGKNQSPVIKPQPTAEIFSTSQVREDAIRAVHQEMQTDGGAFTLGDLQATLSRLAGRPATREEVLGFGRVAHLQVIPGPEKKLRIRTADEITGENPSAKREKAGHGDKCRRPDAPKPMQPPPPPKPPLSAAGQIIAEYAERLKKLNIPVTADMLVDALRVSQNNLDGWKEAVAKQPALEAELKKHDILPEGHLPRTMAFGTWMNELNFMLPILEQAKAGKLISPEEFKRQLHQIDATISPAIIKGLTKKYEPYGLKFKS